MMRLAWIAGWIGAGLNAAALFTSGMAWAITGDDRWDPITFALFMFCLATIGGMTMWSKDAPARTTSADRALDRAEAELDAAERRQGRRDELARRRQRLSERLEREAGIR